MKKRYMKEKAIYNEFKGNAIYNMCPYNTKCNKSRICVKRPNCLSPKQEQDKINEQEDFYELRDRFNRGEIK